jgi:hypothetical protein
MKATFTGALARDPEGGVAPRAAAMVAAVIDPASAPRPTRVAFVGQATFFEACALGPGGHGFDPRFFEYRAGADANRLVAALGAFDPDVVLVFRPEIVPGGAFEDLRALTVGFLTEPLPRTARGAPVHDDLVKRLRELRKVDRANFDRVVSFDPYIARTADEVVPVWRSLPLPVADRFYRPVGTGPLRPQSLFVGRSTPHREWLMVNAKHDFEIMHVAFGAGADELERLMGEHDVAINAHNNPYPSFENRVCLHVAAGHLVLSEPLDPLHGLEPGIDFVQFELPGQLSEALRAIRDTPMIWRRVRIRGRRKAEQYRASRVYPRLFRDLAADVRAFGSARTARDGVGARLAA